MSSLACFRPASGKAADAAARMRSTAFETPSAPQPSAGARSTSSTPPELITIRSTTRSIKLPRPSAPIAAICRSFSSSRARSVGLGARAGAIVAVAGVSEPGDMPGWKMVA
eukprot:scaffold88741_cov38-Tisochrysis_lutea.AAC.4